MEKFLSVRQASLLLDLHEHTLRRWIREGSLPSIHFGHSVRIPARSIEALVGQVQELAQPPAPAPAPDPEECGK